MLFKKEYHTLEETSTLLLEGYLELSLGWLSEICTGQLPIGS